MHPGKKQVHCDYCNEADKSDASLAETFGIDVQSLPNWSPAVCPEIKELYCEFIAGGILTISFDEDLAYKTSAFTKDEPELYEKDKAVVEKRCQALAATVLDDNADNDHNFLTHSRANNGSPAPFEQKSKAEFLRSMVALEGSTEEINLAMPDNKGLEGWWAWLKKSTANLKAKNGHYSDSSTLTFWTHHVLDTAYQVSSESSYQKDFASKCDSFIKAGIELLATEPPIELRVSVAQTVSDAMSALEHMNTYLLTNQELKSKDDTWLDFALKLNSDFERHLHSTPTQKDLRTLTLVISNTTFSQRKLDRRLARFREKVKVTS